MINKRFCSLYLSYTTVDLFSFSLNSFNYVTYLINYEILYITEATLFLERNWEKEESIHEEDIMYSFCTYIAENAESLNLVEGEKVYVLG